MRTVRQALVQIEGENPTLTLVTGEEYTLEWTNVNGGFHNFMIETTGEETPVETETMSEEGERRPSTSP